MNPRTILTLADGRSIDLLNPQPSDYGDFGWAAEHLAKENRYNGATPGVVYSVAQHTSECVRAVMRESGDRDLAAYLSLHDVAESVLKDDTTPKKNALAAKAEQKFGVLASQIMEVFDELTADHDRAIHAAAGLAWPPTPEMARAIKHFDRVLLVTEWRDLMGGAPLPNADAYADVTPLPRRIIPLNRWDSAAMLLRTQWRELLPVFSIETA